MSFTRHPSGQWRFSSGGRKPWKNLDPTQTPVQGPVTPGPHDPAGLRSVLEVRQLDKDFVTWGTTKTIYTPEQLLLRWGNPITETEGIWEVADGPFGPFEITAKPHDPDRPFILRDSEIPPKPEPYNPGRLSVSSGQIIATGRFSVRPPTSSTDKRTIQVDLHGILPIYPPTEPRTYHVRIVPEGENPSTDVLITYMKGDSSGTTFPDETDPDLKRIKVATFNIEYLFRTPHPDCTVPHSRPLNAARSNAIARVFNGIGADIWALQEIDGEAGKLKRMISDTSLFDESYSSYHIWEIGGPLHPVIISRYPIVHFKNHKDDLPFRSNLLQADIDVDGEIVTVINAHLNPA